MNKIVVKNRQGIYTLKLEDVFYMEKRLRKIRLYAKGIEGGYVDFYGKFCDVMPYLDERFLHCHRSYVINMDKIVVMTQNTIYVENNRGICMGQNTYGKARKIFSEYMLKKTC